MTYFLLLIIAMVNVYLQLASDTQGDADMYFIASNVYIVCLFILGELKRKND